MVSYVSIMAVVVVVAVVAVSGSSLTTSLTLLEQHAMAKILREPPKDLPSIYYSTLALTGNLAGMNEDFISQGFHFARFIFARISFRKDFVSQGFHFARISFRKIYFGEDLFS